uniref:Uncharacterized protein n=1 Tax=Lactuca sativa TaxID=4236 RepID=A0A9R1X5Q3_LACSA|nr:hypothetical protein LSAT_V11C700382630 [Lactuca sativa]
MDYTEAGLLHVGVGHLLEADSRSPLQRSDSNGLPGPMGLMSTSHLEQEAAVLALSTLMTIAPAQVYAVFEKGSRIKDKLIHNVYETPYTLLLNGEINYRGEIEQRSMGWLNYSIWILITQ